MNSSSIDQKKKRIQKMSTTLTKKKWFVDGFKDQKQVSLNEVLENHTIGAQFVALGSFSLIVGRCCSHQQLSALDYQHFRTLHSHYAGEMCRRWRRVCWHQQLVRACLRVCVVKSSTLTPTTTCDATARQSTAALFRCSRATTAHSFKSTTVRK